ncbi:MAG: hypothetical protein HZA83_03150, partial [Thaumarchaeota archaeon]|nr:hypothetical protein [Nitrososphaerota archaeon]
MQQPHNLILINGDTVADNVKSLGSIAERQSALRQRLIDARKARAAALHAAEAPKPPTVPEPLHEDARPAQLLHIEPPVLQAPLDPQVSERIIKDPNTELDVALREVDTLIGMENDQGACWRIFADQSIRQEIRDAIRENAEGRKKEELFENRNDLQYIAGEINACAPFSVDVAYFAIGLL